MKSEVPDILKNKKLVFGDKDQVKALKKYEKSIVQGLYKISTTTTITHTIQADSVDDALEEAEKRGDNPKLIKIIRSKS